MASRTRRLAKARKVRRLLSTDLANLKAGRLSLRTVLVDQGFLGPCRVWTLLITTPGLGTVGAKKICETANVWPENRLQNLTLQERRRLLEALPSRVK